MKDGLFFDFWLDYLTKVEDKLALEQEGTFLQ